ncbi:MAG: DUF1800 domain-containing protein [Pseudomonadota bacterium]
MKRLLASSAATIAICAALPAVAGPDAMTSEEARHLISRTGFGASPDEIAAMTGLSYQAAVDQIIAGIVTEPSRPMPAWVDAWAYPYDQIWTLNETASDLFFNNRWMEGEQLQQWWLAEMVETPSPLTEKLTLFWHDHFATNALEHENPQWAAQQNRFFRANAAGNFADLAEGILKDPAMLVYLTNTENAKEAPNENLAREYMELFTLGEGRGYTEEDVVAAARALTGFTINDFGAGNFVFDEEMHDFRRKTILGKTGRFDGEDLPTIVMQNENFGPYIVEKLWKTFVSDQPDPTEVTRLTTIWREADWELQPLLRAMFRTDAFWAAENRATIVKSPVELMVGSVRTFGIDVPNAGHLAWAVGDLGQQLFFPPNVGGWPGGTDWINNATASGRATMLTYMLDYDPEPLENDGSMMMMQAGGAATAPTESDFHVGQVFTLEADRREDDRGVVTLTLFDVRFQDHHWRSVSFVADVGGPEDFEIAMQVSDCAPDCFADWPLAEEDPYGWIWFDSEQIAEGDIDWMRPMDRDLVGAIMGHLPDLLQSTRDQRVWRSEPWDDGERLTEREVLTGTVWLASFAATHFGPPVADLTLSPHPPASVGLGGIDARGLSEEEVDEMYEMLEEANLFGTAPPVTYDSAEDWLAALPDGGFDSLRAEAALLATSLPAEGRRMEKVATDPEALIRAIVLSPYYQLN